jgi:TonB family protein
MNNKTAPTILMMLVAFLCLSHLTEAAAGAQTPDISSWIKVSPAGEGFTVLMPHFPVVTSEKKRHDKFKLDASLYTVTTPQNAIYTIWSLHGQAKANLTAQEIDDFLDACIELVWNEIKQVKSENAGQDNPGHKDMKYARGLQLAGTFPGREYEIYQGPKVGLARIYYAGPQSYLVMALNVKPDGLEEANQFIDSFVVTEPSSLPPSSASSNPLLARPVSPDVYLGQEVSQKARILSRPEPQYTEAARKFQVSGTVVLKAVMAADGQMTDIRAVSRLPHGLTRASIEAARQIQFQPAMKDGRPVSQYIQIMYNYSVY